MRGMPPREAPTNEKSRAACRDKEHIIFSSKQSLFHKSVSRVATASGLFLHSGNSNKVLKGRSAEAAQSIQFSKP